MEFHDSEWARKGATLSDKTACSEYGLTQDEIFAAIDAGKLQYRPAAMHGNPWLRLLRSEVEDLAKALHGERHVRDQQARTELARVNRELKQLGLSSLCLRKGGRRFSLNSASNAQPGWSCLPCPPPFCWLSRTNQCCMLRGLQPVGSSVPGSGHGGV